MIELFFIWFALSARTPRIEPNPFDYEVSSGIQLKITEIASFIDEISIDNNFLYERENDKNYNGRIHNYDLKYILAGEYVKTAKNISKQKVIIKYPYKIWKAKIDIGLANLWQEYENRITTIYGKITSPYLEGEVAGHGKVEMAKLKAKYRYKLFGGFYIQPSCVYFYDGKREDYQAKIKVGYTWQRNK